VQATAAVPRVVGVRQLGRAVQAPVRDVQDELLVRAEQPHDRRRPAVPQRVAGQLGGHQRHPVGELRRAQPVPVQRAVQLGAQPAQFIGGGELPVLQLGSLFWRR
jgi:hypothetical protein